MLPDFQSRVLSFIKAIPAGRVVSYGQVAAACGKPRGAREVGWILRGLSDHDKIPWWRVINNQGEISIKGNWTATKEIQAGLLRKERVEVSEGMKVDIGRYRYRS